MAELDDIRSGLHDAAASIDVGSPDDARSDVHGIAHRRRMRTRVAAGLGVVALVVGGAVAFATLGQSDDPDMLVSADPTVPTDEATDTAPTDSAALTPTSTIPVVEPPRVPGVAVDAPTETAFAFPWRDGFVAGSVGFPPQLLPAELPPEIAALFPQEVIDLFAGGLPATIAEATTMLSEAGLLDEVSAIISANPEASAAIYGEPNTDPPTVDARFTTDGEEWETIEMTLPAGATYFDSLATAGDRLAVMFNEQQTPVGQSASVVTVATTTDLVNWTTQEVRPPALPVELPAGIRRYVNGQGLVANDTGWAMTVFDSVDVDVLQLVPDDVRAKIESSSGGFGASPDTDGIRIDYAADATSSSTETLTFTWEELGVPADVVAYVTDNEYRPQTWAATWDGVPAQADPIAGTWQMLATSDGFLQWTDETFFSTDGLTWTASPLPDPDGNISGGFAVEGGVVVMSTSRDGTVDVYRLDETGGSPRPVDVSNLPETFQAGFSGPWAPGSAVVVDAADPTRSGPDEYVADLWLVSSNDGERVVATDLDDVNVDVGPIGVVTNGDVALVQVGGRWTRFDLP
jgi:hypothetical protein